VTGRDVKVVPQKHKQAQTHAQTPWAVTLDWHSHGAVLPGATPDGWKKEGRSEGCNPPLSGVKKIKTRK